MSGSTRAASILFAALVACFADADILVLEGGERLSGEVVRVTEGTLVFRTTLAGQMMVPMDTVEALATKGNLVVSMRDQRVHYGRFARETGEPQILPLDGSAPQPVDLAQVDEALPIPSPPGSDEEDYEEKLAAWRASVETGVHRRFGNRDYTDAFARLEVSRESERSAFRSEVLVERSDPDDFPRLLRADAEVRREADGTVQPYAQAGAERDTNAALDLRAELSLGLARQFFETDTHALDGRVGLNVAYEDWDVSPLRERRVRVFGEDLEKTTEELNMQLGLRYSRALFKNGTLSEDLVFYPGLTDLGTLRARSTTAVTYPLLSRLKLRLDVLVDFDSEPEFRGLDEWGASVGASVRVDF